MVKVIRAGRALHHLAADLGKHRRQHPTVGSTNDATAGNAPATDLTSALVTANIDGEHLTDQEFGSFFILLVVAGNETTRTAISHGLKLLTDHPDQLENPTG